MERPYTSIEETAGFAEFEAEEAAREEFIAEEAAVAAYFARREEGYAGSFEDFLSYGGN